MNVFIAVPYISIYLTFVCSCMFYFKSFWTRLRASELQTAAGVLTVSLEERRASSRKTHISQSQEKRIAAPSRSIQS